ncbi:hypothetical protein FQN54_007101 [Arachnomyces sp. PD_36]|nr:hypothetical protein FQN54_007101 [Arachnomyces sp. PD_36]
MDPLQDLLEHLQEAVKTPYPNETISIPRNIINAVLRLSPLPDFQGIDGLVALFDGINEGYSSRLDIASFQCVLYVLLGGQWSLARERGLYLFLSSVRQLGGTHVAKQSTALSVSHQPKSTVGQKTLQLCLTHFTDADGAEILRLWSGKLLLELIRGSRGNKELLVASPEETRRGLGKIVLYGHDYALRFIAGDIIREMTSTKFDLKPLWPLGSVEKLGAMFPSSRLAGSRWIRDFNAFVRETDEELYGGATDRKPYVDVAQSIAGGGQSPVGNVPSLAIVASSRLTFIQPATSDTTTEFIDITFNNIERCYHEEKDYSSINIQLVKHGRGNCMRDGSMMNVDEFFIRFKDREQAGVFLAAIERKSSHLGRLLQGADENKRHMSAAYVALDGTSLSASTSVGVYPVIHHSTPKRKEAPRLASFAMFSLPSEEEVAARSSALLNSQRSPRNEPVIATIESADSTAITDYRSFINAVGKSGTLHETKDSIELGDVENHTPSAPDLPILAEANSHPTIEHPIGTQLEGVNADSNGQFISVARVVCSEGSMRLQKNEGPKTHPKTVSPIRETPRPSQDDTSRLNTISPGPDPSQGDCSHQRNNNDLSCFTEPGANVVEIPDSQQENTNLAEPQPTRNMALTDSVPPPKTKPLGNTTKTSNAPSGIVSASRLKRPRLKVAGAGCKRQVTDWDQDLRVSDDEREVAGQKSPKVSPRAVPMPTKARKVPATKARQAKPMLKTPKTETPATVKNPTMPRKRAPTKTLTSSRQLRAAAGKAKVKIANAKDDESDNFDVEDPIETTSPESSALETPINKPSMHKKVHGPEKANPCPSIQENAYSHDSHTPIILDSPLGDEAIQANSLLEKPLASPPLKETLLISTSPSGLDPRLLGCVDPELHSQEFDDLAFGKDSNSIDAEVCSAIGGTSHHSDDVSPAFESSSPKEIGDSSNKKTFAEKLSLALVGAGILLKSDDEISERPIIQVEESSDSPRIGPSKSTASFPQGKVSQVSQKVAEFMSRKSKVERLPPNADHASVDQGALGFEERSPNDGYILHPAKKANSPDRSGSQAVTKAHESTDTTPTERPVLSISSGRQSNLGRKIEATHAHPTIDPDDTLVDERIHRKAQVVSFDIDGPRNQGMSSTKKSSIRGPKHITPILKDPKKSMALKRRADAEVKENDIPVEEMLEKPSTPAPKRQMIRHEAEDLSITSDKGTGPVQELLRPELLSQARPAQLFGSQQSMVDPNGSPRRVTRASRLPRMIPRAQNWKGGSYLQGKNSVQLQIPEWSSGSDEENQEPANPHSKPENTEGRQRQENCKPPAPSGARPIFHPFKASAGAPPSEPKLKDSILTSGSNMEKTRFIDSLTLRPETMRYGPEVDSETETEILIDDTDSESSCSTDSTPSESSETLVHLDPDADIEWRNTLRSTQKTTLDILLDTSKRLVRHLVDEETAIADLVTIYHNGCERLVEQLQQAHDASFEERERKMRPVKETLRNTYTTAHGRLRTGREKVRKLPSSKELLSAVSKRKHLVSRLGDMVEGYGS